MAMRIAVLHNFYLETGGEDVVFRSEVELLRSHGHEVLTYTVSNEVIHAISPLQAMRMGMWNTQTYRELRQWFREHRPQVAHFHNILFVLSPSAYQAAYDEGVVVVQTLHNYRLICPGGQLLRNHKPCELCVGKQLPLWGVLYGCYKSRSATVGATLHILRQRPLWRYAVQRFIALTEFSRQKFIQGGLPPEKVVVKPNFLAPDPGEGTHDGGYALYVGRLSKEKGIDVMLDAWAQMPAEIPLKIVGDGPLADLVRQASERQAHIQWLGKQPRETVLTLMKQARLLVFPSICYENMSLAIVEAMATGLPVVASGHGSMATMIWHGETGWLFEPGNADALRDQVRIAWEQGARLREVGCAARNEYLQHYTAERNYEALMNIYRQAIQELKGGAVCVS